MFAYRFYRTDLYFSVPFYSGKETYLRLPGPEGDPENSTDLRWWGYHTTQKSDLNNMLL